MRDDRDRWELPPLAVDLEDAVDAGGSALDWAVALVRGDVPTRQLVQAAAWTALRRTPVEGVTILGLVAHGVLAAPAVDRIGTRASPGMAEHAAVNHVAYVASTFDASDIEHGPVCLQWFEANYGGHPDPTTAFRAAATIGNVNAADHAWLALASEDALGAEQELLRAAVGGAHLQTHKLIYPSELRTWFGAEQLDPRLWRAAVRYVANHLQDPTAATQRWHRAESAAGQAHPTRDHDRITRLATRAVQSQSLPAESLLQALRDGMPPSDAAEALALGAAARYAATPFPNGFAVIGPLHATTGAAAVRRLVGVARDETLECALVDCLRDHVDARLLSVLPEIRLPPPDDAALGRLRSALDRRLPDEAVEAALAMPDEQAPEAWQCLHDTVLVDQWLVQHGPKQSVALHDRYLDSDHPLRRVYLGATARTAAMIRTLPQPRSERIRTLLG